MTQAAKDKNFINFHVLISHSPSCLNRDDMNMQKSAVFGGKRRVRISSQSLKRTMRTSKYYQEHLGEPSTRTIHLWDAKKNNLKQKAIKDLEGRYEADLVAKAIEWLCGKELDSGEKVENDAVAPWAIEEIAYFCEQIQNNDDFDKKKLQKKIEKDGQAYRQALANGLDIALSGRMATSGLMSEIGKVDGSLAVAHAITTHAVDADIDWFTAVDDLQELGSGHLNTQEFSSGVFYRYASLNIQQLQKNLGDANREAALEIASHVLHLLSTEVPSAKQQSFAAHNLADQALVSFSDQPISLANAFEKPVQADYQGGFRLNSINALHNYWDRVHRGYGLNERCAEFSIEDIELPEGITKKESLSDLKAWIRNDGNDQNKMG